VQEALQTLRFTLKRAANPIERFCGAPWLTLNAKPKMLARRWMSTSYLFHLFCELKALAGTVASAPMGGHSATRSVRACFGHGFRAHVAAAERVPAICRQQATRCSWHRAAVRKALTGKQQAAKKGKKG